MSYQRVAIVHDWLTSMRGGERVVEALCRVFPRADLFTLTWDPSRLSPALARRNATTSPIHRVARAPFMNGRFRALLPLFPLAIESFKLDDYDLVVSSSHCVAIGAMAPPTALHVAYMHSTLRYVREGQAIYEASVPGGTLGRAVFRGAAHYMRRWETTAATRPHELIANSSYTRDRIRRYYGRDARVIEPPVDTARFERAAANVPPLDDSAPFLIVSALVPNKRVDLALRAFQGRPERLVVVGEGPERGRLEPLRGPNVTLLSRVDEVELAALFAGCRALLHTGVDDFGMVMVEALAAGKPVIACAEGGALDIVRDGETGLLIESPTVDSVRAALDRFHRLRNAFDPAVLRGFAKRFDSAHFERRFAEAVEESFRRRRDGHLEAEATLRTTVQRSTHAAGSADSDGRNGESHRNGLTNGRAHPSIAVPKNTEVDVASPKNARADVAAHAPNGTHTSSAGRHQNGRRHLPVFSTGGVAGIAASGSAHNGRKLADNPPLSGLTLGSPSLTVNGSGMTPRGSGLALDPSGASLHPESLQGSDSSLQASAFPARVNHGSAAAANGAAERHGTTAAANGTLERRGTAAAANGAAERHRTAAAANGAAERHGTAAAANGAAERHGTAAAANGAADWHRTTAAANGALDWLGSAAAPDRAREGHARAGTPEGSRISNGAHSARPDGVTSPTTPTLPASRDHARSVVDPMFVRDRLAKHSSTLLRVKRAADIAIAASGLAVTAPLVAVLGGLIPLTSPGPALFYQRRTGLHQRPFVLVKLRTMDRQGRVTAIGRLLRPLGLDELPQLWNVLKGDMSVVGPRPELPELVAEFERAHPGFHLRHLVRPGITGWAQVNGLRGHPNLSIAERLRFDVQYMCEWDLAFDARILARTLSTVLKDTLESFQQ